MIHATLEVFATALPTTSHRLVHIPLAGGDDSVVYRNFLCDVLVDCSESTGVRDNPGRSCDAIRFDHSAASRTMLSVGKLRQ